MWVRLDPEPVPDVTMSGGASAWSMRWADSRTHAGLRVRTVTAYAYPLFLEDGFDGRPWDCEVLLAGAWLHRPGDAVSAADFAEWAHYGDPEEVDSVETLRPHLSGFPTEADAMVFGRSYLTRWWKFQRSADYVRMAS